MFHNICDGLYLKLPFLALHNTCKKRLVSNNFVSTNTTAFIKSFRAPFFYFHKICGTQYLLDRFINLPLALLPFSPTFAYCLLRHLKREYWISQKIFKANFMLLQKIKPFWSKGLLIFSGGIEMKHWTKMG